jgi:hypothetical protein
MRWPGNVSPAGSTVTGQYVVPEMNNTRTHNPWARVSAMS